MNTLPVGRIASVQVGQPQTLVTTKGRAWQSAIAKIPVAGPVALGKENLDGDRQANRKYHGGPDKAVCAYCAAHYPDWRVFLLRDLPFGAFGENLTVDGLNEADLCVGDTLAVGDTLLQISQPRQPCVNLSRRWDAPRLPRRMEETGHTGFYCRVLRTGHLASSDALAVVERPHPEWTLLRANRMMYAPGVTPSEIEALRTVPPLSAEWKCMLGRRLRKMAG